MTVQDEFVAFLTKSMYGSNKQGLVVINVWNKFIRGESLFPLFRNQLAS